MKTIDVLNEKNIIISINEIIYRGLESRTSQRDLHSFLQKEISTLSERFALTSKKEFVVRNYCTDHRNGHIDVVWSSGATIVVAFEIDSSLRAKSIRKLVASNASFLFWVYYGNRPYEQLLNSIDIAARVNVLHFSLKAGKTLQKSQCIKAMKKTASSHLKSYSFAKVRLRYANAYKRWTAEEDRILIRLNVEGTTIAEIAKRFQRTTGAIRSRLKKHSKAA